MTQRVLSNTARLVYVLAHPHGFAEVKGIELCSGQLLFIYLFVWIERGGGLHITH